MKRLTFGLLLVAAAPSLAQAQETEKAQARKLVDEGNAALRAGDYQPALAKYREAFAVYPSPKIRLNVAEVHNQLGQFARAMDQYEAYLDETEGETELRAAAKTRLEKLSKKVGTVRITGAGGAVAFVDGVKLGALPVRTRVDPGRHRIRVEQSNHQPFAQDVTIGAGADETVAAKLVPKPPPPERITAAAAPPKADDEAIVKQWWFWTAIGVVIAGGVTAGVVAATTGDDDFLPEGELGSSGTGSWDRF